MSAASNIRNAPQTFELSVRTRDRGGPVRSSVSDSGRLASSGARHLLILVHGYNNTRSEADGSYREFLGGLVKSLRKSRVAPDAVVFFQWPGDTAIGPMKWFDRAGYPFDIARARTSADRLTDYLASFPSPTSAPSSLKITIVAHSLGCRLSVEMLNQLPRQTSQSLEVIHLMAAAVGTRMFSNGAITLPGAISQKISKLFSTADFVLHRVFPLGQAVAFPIIERFPYHEAVGRFGNPPGLGSAFATNNQHNEYWGDTYAADLLISHIDPTFPPPPPRFRRTGRKLVPRDEPRAWSLPKRKLGQ